MSSDIIDSLKNVIVFKGKLIGVDSVPGPRGDKMCQSSMQRLKALIKGTGSHKQRIQIHISFDGVVLKDEKTGEVISSHTIPMISYISRDISDKRAFGFVHGSPDSGHQFVGIKTEKLAAPVMKTIGELFTYVYEQKKRTQSTLSNESSKSNGDNNALSNKNYHTSNSDSNTSAGKLLNFTDSKQNNNPFTENSFMEISNLKEVISSVKLASEPYANWESFDNTFDSTREKSASNLSCSTLGSISISSNTPTSSRSGLPVLPSPPSKSPKIAQHFGTVRIKPPVSSARRQHHQSTSDISFYSTLDNIIPKSTESNFTNTSSSASNASFFDSTPFNSSSFSTQQASTVQFTSPANHLATPVSANSDFFPNSEQFPMPPKVSQTFTPSPIASPQTSNQFAVIQQQKANMNQLFSSPSFNQTANSALNAYASQMVVKFPSPQSITNQFPTPPSTDPFSTPVSAIHKPEFVSPIQHSELSSSSKSFESSKNSDDRYAVFSEIHSMSSSIFDKIEEEKRPSETPPPPIPPRPQRSFFETESNTPPPLLPKRKPINGSPKSNSNPFLSSSESMPSYQTMQQQPYMPQQAIDLNIAPPLPLPQRKISPTRSPFNTESLSSTLPISMGKQQSMPASTNQPIVEGNNGNGNDFGQVSVDSIANTSFDPFNCDFVSSFLSREIDSGINKSRNLDEPWQWS